MEECQSPALSRQPWRLGMAVSLCQGWLRRISVGHQSEGLSEGQPLALAYHVLT
jgi:hypothetical protein